jgi:hypothetical protein
VILKVPYQFLFERRILNGAAFVHAVGSHEQLDAYWGGRGEGSLVRSYLEVTFRKGRPVAAYLHLTRRGNERAARVSKAAPGLLIDYNPDGKPIGIEITAPPSESVSRH